MNSYLFAASCGRASGRLLKQLSVSIFQLPAPTAAPAHLPRPRRSMLLCGLGPLVTRVKTFVVEILLLDSVDSRLCHLSRDTAKVLPRRHSVNRRAAVVTQSRVKLEVH
jgi:hypothetical protein